MLPVSPRRVRRGPPEPETAMTASILEAPAAGERVVDLHFADFAAEHAATRLMLSRVPEQQLDWRPHPKSRTLGELATHVAEIPNRGAAILTLDHVDTTTRPAPTTPPSTTVGLLALHDAA